MFILNPTSGVFKDKKFRTFFKQYLLSVDFTKLGDWNYATSTRYVLPFGLTGYSLFKEFEKLELDDLIPKSPIRIRSYYVNRGIRKIIFPFIQKDIKKHKVEIELNQSDWSELSPRMLRGDFDLTAFYYMVDIPNSFYFYESLFNVSGELNPTGYQVPEAKKLLQEYRMEPDEFKRIKILSQMEKIAHEEAFTIPILNSMCLLGYKSHVINTRIYPVLLIPFEEIDIEKRN